VRTTRFWINLEEPFFYMYLFVLDTEQVTNDPQVSHFYLFLILVQINKIFHKNGLYSIWINNFISPMWKVLLWHCHNKATHYFNPFIMTKYLYVYMEYSPFLWKPHPCHDNTFHISLITLLSHAPYQNCYWDINGVFVIFFSY
jgi:hypothetical protein